jgi:hypothetical protein
MLIIDSIIALFRVEFSGRGELSERQQKLGQHLSVIIIVTFIYTYAYKYAHINVYTYIHIHEFSECDELSKR